jgi:hypothetical protein
MRPDHLLFKDVHQKRVLKVIPEFITMFQRFFGCISDFQLSVAACIVETDACTSLEKDETVLKRISWISMAKWFKMLTPDYDLANVLIHENCITRVPDELIGYWLADLFIVKEIHVEHSRRIVEVQEVVEVQGLVDFQESIEVLEDDLYS